jgi:hypothetical protein
MATPRQIQSLHARRPFEPFQLHLSSGRTIVITHPENIAYGAAGHEIAIRYPGVKSGLAGAVTVLLGTLVRNRDTLIFSAFLLFLGGWFAFDAARYIYLRGCSEFPGTALRTYQSPVIFVMLRKPPRMSARHLRQCYANLPE